MDPVQRIQVGSGFPFFLNTVLSLVVILLFHCKRYRALFFPEKRVFFIGFRLERKDLVAEAPLIKFRVKIVFSINRSKPSVTRNSEHAELKIHRLGNGNPKFLLFRIIVILTENEFFDRRYLHGFPGGLQFHPVKLPAVLYYINKSTENTVLWPFWSHLDLVDKVPPVIKKGAS